MLHALIKLDFLKQFPLVLQLYYKYCMSNIPLPSLPSQKRNADILQNTQRIHVNLLKSKYYR